MEQTTISNEVKYIIREDSRTRTFIIVARYESGMTSLLAEVYSKYTVLPVLKGIKEDIRNASLYVINGKGTFKTFRSFLNVIKLPDGYTEVTEEWFKS